jgi:hypothetical protein
MFIKDRFSLPATADNTGQKVEHPNADALLLALNVICSLLAEREQFQF